MIPKEEEAAPYLNIIPKEEEEEEEEIKKPM